MLNKYTKALVGALVAGLGALQVALADNVVTNNEWITVASATVAALGFVWGVKNEDPKPKADDPNALPDEVK